MQSTLALQTNNHHYILRNNTMSNTLMRELDFKMQQIREYGMITHGYYNENIQYPVHVRRSHDGEKLPGTVPIVSKLDNHQKKNHSSNPTILTSSSYENRTKIKKKEPSYDERHTTLVTPPNKTVNDIKPSLHCDRLHLHRYSSSSSANSSPILCSSRPHSIAGISLPTTDEEQINCLSHSSHSLINPSTPTKTLTQRFFSKFFHHSSKS